MKHKKQEPEQRREIPPKSAPEVPKADRERAENEGMTAKPNRDPINSEDAKLGKAHANAPADASTAESPVPEAQADAATKDGVEGEGSYTAARRYREGLERSVREDHTEELARQAAKALDGPEGDSLRAAEDVAKHGKATAASPDARTKSERALRRPADKKSHQGHATSNR
jgi:hypothetical protein